MCLQIHSLLNPIDSIWFPKKLSIVFSQKTRTKAHVLFFLHRTKNSSSEDLEIILPRKVYTMLFLLRILFILPTQDKSTLSELKIRSDLV